MVDTLDQTSKQRRSSIGPPSSFSKQGFPFLKHSDSESEPKIQNRRNSLTGPIVQNNNAHFHQRRNSLPNAKLETHHHMNDKLIPSKRSTQTFDDFRLLVRQSDYGIPEEQLPGLFNHYQNLKVTLSAKGIEMPPSSLLKSILVNSKDTINVRRRRQSVPNIKLPNRRNSAPLPPPYELLAKADGVNNFALQKPPPPPRRKSQSDPPDSSPIKKSPVHSINHFKPKGDLSRTRRYSTGVTAPSKLQNDIHAAMLERTRHAQHRHNEEKEALQKQIEELTKKVERQTQYLLDKDDEMEQLSSKLQETEDQLERRLADAIESNEQLKTLHHALRVKTFESKEHSRRSRQKIDAIFDVVRDLLIAPSFQLRKVLDVIKSRTARVIGAERVDIYVIDQTSKELVSYREKRKSSLPPPMGANVWRGRYPLDSGIVGVTIAENSSQLVTDVTTDKRFDSFVDGIGVNGVKDLITYPVVSTTNVIAVIVAVNKKPPRRASISHKSDDNNTGRSNSSNITPLTADSHSPPVFTAIDVATIDDLSKLTSLVIQQYFSINQEAEL